MNPLDSLWPLYSFERRADDLKMVLLRVVSAIALIFFLIQLAKEPENLDGLASFTSDSMNDLFDWGNDRFVLGQLADKAHAGNSTGVKRKKSPQEIFMEAILDPEPEDEPKKEEEPVPEVNHESENIDEAFEEEALTGDDL